MVRYVYTYIYIYSKPYTIWVVVKIMVPFWVLNIIRHEVFRDPREDHNFDNHSYTVLLDPYVYVLFWGHLGRPVVRPWAGEGDFTVEARMRTAPGREYIGL